MERKYFVNQYKLKAQIATLENGQFCLTRYGYPDAEMRNKAFDQRITKTYEDAVSIIESIYKDDMQMHEANEEEFLLSFSPDKESRKKVGEMWFGSVHFIIYFCYGKTITYRIIRKWWDGGWRTSTEAVFADMEAVTKWLHAFARRGDWSL